MTGQALGSSTGELYPALCDGVRADIARLLRTLQELEFHWRRQEAPIAGLLRPPATDADLQLVRHETGSLVPTELRAWWGWHDGQERGRHLADSVGPGGYRLLSVAESVAEYHANRSIHRAPFDPNDPSDNAYWHESWLPFLVQGPQRVYVDCAEVAPGNASPVRIVTWEWEDYDVVQAPSVAALAGLMLAELRTDRIRWNSDRGDWDDRRRLPDDRPRRPDGAFSALMG